MMLPLNLIKSDNEWMIKLGKRGLEDESTESKINEFDFDFEEKLKIEERVFFQKEKSRNNRK